MKKHSDDGEHDEGLPVITLGLTSWPVVRGGATCLRPDCSTYIGCTAAGMESALAS